MVVASAPATSITLQAREILGESVIFIGPATLIASKSTPGQWYIVDGGRCSCPGFTYRGTCRHLAPALEAAEFDRKSCEPAVLSSRGCRRCGAYDGQDGLCVLCAAAEPDWEPAWIAEQERDDTRPLDPIPEPVQHNYPGRHAAYGVPKVCASCGVSYRGPRLHRSLLRVLHRLAPALSMLGRQETDPTEEEPPWNHTISHFELLTRPTKRS